MTRNPTTAEHKAQLEGIVTRRKVVPEFLEDMIEAVEDE